MPAHLTITPEVERALGKSAAELARMPLSKLSDLVWSKGLKIKVHPFRECAPPEEGGATLRMETDDSAVAAES